MLASITSFKKYNMADDKTSIDFEKYAIIENNNNQVKHVKYAGSICDDCGCNCPPADEGDYCLCNQSRGCYWCGCTS